MKKYILIYLSMILLGCSEGFKGNFSKLSPLREDIISKTDVEDVRVIINNGNCIGVSFINSKYNEEDSLTQEQIRTNTLDIISSHYEPGDGINSAYIAFVSHKKYFFLINYTNSLNTKFYDYMSDTTWKMKY